MGISTADAAKTSRIVADGFDTANGIQPAAGPDDPSSITPTEGISHRKS